MVEMSPKNRPAKSEKPDPPLGPPPRRPGRRRRLPPWHLNALYDRHSHDRRQAPPLLHSAQALSLQEVLFRFPFCALPRLLFYWSPLHDRLAFYKMDEFWRKGSQVHPRVPASRVSSAHRAEPGS